MLRVEVYFTDDTKYIQHELKKHEPRAHPKMMSRY